MSNPTKDPQAELIEAVGQLKAATIALLRDYYKTRSDGELSDNAERALARVIAAIEGMKE